jgi:hypothetical protein
MQRTTGNPESQAHADDDGAFTVKEFCARYGIGHTAFYEEVNSGRLIAKKRGNRTLIPRASARAWVNSLPTMNSRSAVAAA